MRLEVAVFTCDRHSWALGPFAYLFNRYWGEEYFVRVFGYTPPAQALPRNFAFFSIANEEYPAQRWSDGLLAALNMIPKRAKAFVLMLEDYWLCRHVDKRAVEILYLNVRRYPNRNVLRLDLTCDRLGSGRARDFASWGYLDIITTPNDTQYQFSLQAAIWSMRLLPKIVPPGKSPWELELYTRLEEPIAVLGTRQCPVKYINAIKGGRLDWSQIALLNPADRKAIEPMIPVEVLQDAIKP